MVFGGTLVILSFMFFQWEAQHDGVTCADFKAWKIANDPDNQMHGLQDHLAENGISKYFLNVSFIVVSKFFLYS